MEPILSSLTRHVLGLVKADGYRVSVFRNSGSLRGTVAPFVEIQAVLDSADPPQKYVVNVLVDEHADPEYLCACRLAEAVGIDLE